jgi:hypothetical protein
MPLRISVLSRGWRPTGDGRNHADSLQAHTENTGGGKALWQ